MNSNINLTDKEKLAKVKEIIENNLYPVFTSFALDLHNRAKGNKLEKYVELKELLNITSGMIDKQTAIKYDKFKTSKKDLYNNLMNKLDERMVFLNDNGGAPFHKDKNLSTYMFMSAFYPVFCHNTSEDMTENDYNIMIDNINGFLFCSG